MSASDMKDSNPKDALGSDKAPLDLFPDTAILLGSLAFFEGKGKYGGNNWRVKGARATVYVAALRRHIAKWFQGEENDPESGVPHLGHALACLAVLIETQAIGNLIDDRPPLSKAYMELIDRLTPLVAKIKERHKDKNPHHYTIQDTLEPKEPPCPPTERRRAQRRQSKLTLRPETERRAPPSSR